MELICRIMPPLRPFIWLIGVFILLSILRHHERKATHQERTELGKAGLFKPHQPTPEQYQHDAKEGGLPVAENPIYHF
jgi:hypothetical protein